MRKHLALAHKQSRPAAVNASGNLCGCCQTFSTQFRSKQCFILLKTLHFSYSLTNMACYDLCTNSSCLYHHFPFNPQTSQRRQSKHEKWMSQPAFSFISGMHLALQVNTGKCVLRTWTVLILFITLHLSLDFIKYLLLPESYNKIELS